MKCAVQQKFVTVSFNINIKIYLTFLSPKNQDATYPKDRHKALWAGLHGSPRTPWTMVTVLAEMYY